MLGIFFLSGASALVYQVIWARQLALVFGNTTTSIAIVLAAFMAGLALGAGLAGRLLVGLGNPLRTYALLEGGIAVWALLFASLVSAMESLYPALFSTATSVEALIAFRALFAFALLLVPTTMMGATLPLLSEALHRLGLHPEDWNAGRLYAANTLGAAFGSVASGFVLIELVGIRATTGLAALFNAMVMVIGLVLSMRVPTARPAAPVPGLAQTEAPPTQQRFLLAFFAGVGGLALAAEVLWTRALTFMLGSSTYAFSSVLIVWLVGIALGSWLMAGRVRRLERPARLLPALVVAAGIWHVLAIRAIPALHAVAVQIRFGQPAMPPDQMALGIVLVFAALLVLLVPPALLSGALFPLVTRLLGGAAGDRGGPIARAYAWNTVGAVAGSLVAGFLIAPNFVHFHAIEVLALGYAALAAFAVWRLGLRAAFRFAAATAIWIVGLAGFAALSLARPDPLLSILTAGSRDMEIPFHEAGLQGVATVRHPRGQADQWSSLLVDGVGMTVKAFTTKAMVHLPIIAHGRAEDTLVIAFGMGTTFRAALSHGGRVEVVELVPEVFEAFDHFHADAERVRRNPQGRMLVNDGRNFLLLTRKKYDVVSVDPPPPIDGAGVNNLYSREFLELIRDHLAPGGIAAHWVPSPELPNNGVADAWTEEMLILTFMDVFPHVRAVSGAPYGTHLLGSLEPFVLEPARLRAALATPAVRRDLEEFAWDPFLAERFFVEVPLPAAGDGGPPLLTDDHPRLEFNLIRNARRGLLHTMLRVSP